MLKAKTDKILLLFISAVAIAALGYWLAYNPTDDFTARFPGLDNRPAKDQGDNELVNIGEDFNFYNDFDSELVGTWPRFRGADFDNINKEQIPLIDGWANEKPKILWETDLGEGHAAPVIVQGRVYILDYDEAKKADVLRCFALPTGEPLWDRSYRVHIKRNHGMSRTVPAVNQKYVLTLGPRGHVMCCDRISGDLIWAMDLVKDYGAEIPFWYTGQCPLIDDNVAVLAPGGKILLMGVDCATGEILWQSPNPGGWQMSHSSIMPLRLAGKNMYVYAAVGGICGISAEADDLGEVLWTSTAFAPSVLAPSPIALPENKLFITAGYGAGAAMFQISKAGDGFSIDLLYQYKPKDGLASEQQTPLVIDDMVYGILPKDAGNLRNRFVCCHPDDLTKFVWSSSKTERFGLGPYIYADGKCFILDDDGTLNIARISKNGFQILDKRRIIEGHDAWAPIAIADGYLLMRDSKKMVCLDMRKK